MASYFFTDWSLNCNLPILNIWKKPNYTTTLSINFDTPENAKFGYKHKTYHLYNYAPFYREPTFLLSYSGFVFSYFTTSIKSNTKWNTIQYNYKTVVALKPEGVKFSAKNFSYASVLKSQT